MFDGQVLFVKFVDYVVGLFEVDEVEMFEFVESFGVIGLVEVGWSGKEVSCCFVYVLCYQVFVVWLYVVNGDVGFVMFKILYFVGCQDFDFDFRFLFVKMFQDWWQVVCGNEFGCCYCYFFF